MVPTIRRRASPVTAPQKISASNAGDLALNVIPRSNLSPARRTVCPDPSTPAAIDENDSGMNTSPCHYPPYKPSIQCRRSQRTLGFDRYGASSNGPVASATITDTEDDDVSLSKRSQNEFRHRREAKVAFKIRNKYIRKSALQPMIGRSSLRSATHSGGVPDHFPLTLVIDQAAAADSSPARTHRQRQKIIEYMNGIDCFRAHAIRPLSKPKSVSQPTVFSSAPLTIMDRPKRERIPTNFYEPSFMQKIKTTSNVSKRSSPSESMKLVPSFVCTALKENKDQEPITKLAPRTATLPCFDIPTKATSPSKIELVLEKRNRVPTDFYRPNSSKDKAFPSLIADTNHNLYVRNAFKKKNERASLAIPASKSNKNPTRSVCTFAISLVAKERGKCNETVVRLTVGLQCSNFTAAVSGRPQTRCIRLSQYRKCIALQNNEPPALNASPSDSVTTSATREERTTTNTRSRLQSPDAVLKGAVMRSRSRSSRSIQGNGSCSRPDSSRSVDTLEVNVSGPQGALKDKSLLLKLPYETLLSNYNDKASQGRCLRVHFGRTLKSACAAVDRVLREMSKQVPEDIVDLDILADAREYKRSLRFFTIYEDREKLALVHEAQEDMETGGRLEVQGKANQLVTSKGRSELNVLCNRPVFFRSSCFMSRRCTLQCRSGPNCVVCCSGQLMDSTAVSTVSDYTPIPMIESIDIDNESDTEISSAMSTKKRKRTSIQPNNVVRATIDALTELKHSLQFIERYNERSTFEN